MTKPSELECRQSYDCAVSGLQTSKMKCLQKWVSELLEAELGLLTMVWAKVPTLP